MGAYLLAMVVGLAMELFDEEEGCANVGFEISPESVFALLEDGFKSRYSHRVNHQDIHRHTLLIQLLPQPLHTIPILQNITHPSTDVRIRV